jgi:PKD repeat protein
MYQPDSLLYIVGKKRSPKRCSVVQGARTERGAAEMVGVLMLISIFVVVIAIIAVVLFSSPPPDKNPAVNLRITNESRLIKIYHAGGDPLLKDKIQIYVDGTLRAFNGFGMDNTWSLGEVLEYTVPVSDPMPNKIDIVYSESPWHGTNSALIATLVFGSQTNVQPDVTVFSITASAGSGGTITPSGSVSVNDGSSQTFTITQNAGYSILDVVVNGTSQGPIPSYTFTNVRSDQIISATFQLIGPPAPVANFTGTPTSGFAPMTVAFTDTSTNSPTSWLWTFGDGDTINNTQQYPLHIYVNAGNYSVTLTASNAGGNNTIVRTGYITVSPTYTQRVVAGRSTSYTDTTGKVWSVDRTYSAGIWGNTGGSTYSNSNTISGTPDPDLYRSERYGNFQYQFTVPNGNYQVTLKFAEIYWSAVGQRVFNVNIEGTRVMSNVDLNSLVGANTAYDRTFAVTVSDGILNIDFQTIIDNAKISAIEVVSGTSTPTPPVAGFTGTPVSGLSPLDVQFTDTSTGGAPTSWKWEYNKTIAGSWTQFNTSQNPLNTFTEGTYDIRFTATNLFGSNTVTQLSYITATTSHNITATAGVGGAIAPPGEVTVAYGANQAFTITPNTGYHITDVVVDSESQGAITTYIFNNVVVAHTISASFAINAPTFTSVTPASGPTTGGTDVTITGTNLTGATVVTFGGIAATGITVIDANTITVTTPAHAAGAVNVVVTTPGGIATGTGAYTYVVPPTVTARSNATLNRGWQGYELITGTGFVSGAQSILNTTTGYSIASTTCVVSSSTQMFCSYNLLEATVIPSYRVAVINPDGQSAIMNPPTSNYVNVASPAPTLTARSPTTAVRGWPVSVTLTGTNFQPGATVNMTRSGVVINADSVVVVSPTSITCTFDLLGATAATNWLIRVTNTDGQFTASTTMTFTVTNTVTVTSVTPASGQHGTTVTITNIAGTGFQPGVTEVRFSRDTAGITNPILLTNINVESSTKISGTLVIPPLQTVQTLYIRVTNADSTTRISGSRIFSVTT